MIRLSSGLSSGLSLRSQVPSKSIIRSKNLIFYSVSFIKAERGTSIHISHKDTKEQKKAAAEFNRKTRMCKLT